MKFCQLNEQLNRRVKWLILLMAVGLLTYTSLRAALLSMTHDESSTFLNYLHQSVWECFYSEVCWGTANMHLLNTFLMQVSVKVFGTHPLAVRLPNVLAHALYLYFSYRLVSYLSDRWLIQLTGFALLNVQPYLLDFFAVARGYGLACGWCMMSLYFLAVYVHRQRGDVLAGCLVGAVLAVLSNFTFLNYLAVLGASLGGFLLLVSRKSWQQKGLHLGGMALVAALLGALLYNPIRFLQGKGEFGYGESSLMLSFKHLMQDNLYGQGYFGAKTADVFLWLCTGLVALSIGFGLWQGLRRGRESTSGAFYLVVCSLWVLLLLGLWVQHAWLGTQYLDHRTALVFFPLATLPLLMGVVFLARRQPGLAQGVAGLLLVFTLYHFSRASNLVYVREWYYDAHTHEVIDYLQQQVEAGEEVSLGVYWIFTHSANFYRLTRGLDWLNEVLYDTRLRPEAGYDYYYVEPGQGDLLGPGYELEKKFGLVGALYKKQANDQARK